MAAGRFLDHARPRALLESALATGELPPALLLTGPHGVGKEEAALELAMALNCNAATGSGLDLFTAPAAGTATAAGDSGTENRLGGCRICSNCDRIARYGHPDVIVRLPLPRPKGKPDEPADPNEALQFKAAHPYRDPVIEGKNLSIGIADVRAVIGELGMSPVEDGRRVIIFRETEMMTEPAQNALLKSLEEPPSHTIFILTTDRPQALLPTIRSRCRTLYFGPLPADIIADWLRERGFESELEHLPVLARGSLKRALKIAGGEIPGREEALQLLRWAAAGERVEALRWAAGHTFRSGMGAQIHARELITELLSLLRDVAALQSGEGKLQNPDRVDLLQRLAGTIRPGGGQEALAAILQASGEVDRFVNLALIYAGLYEAISPA
jgi:DNA polymerase-3 subunit delta'